ncbi:MAG: J domain-containing protein [Terracidiphilus sp.]
METPNYYEFLQISPNAESETIHRVYRFLAARFHPDNTATGDAEKFFLLKEAYEVLSHPDRRAKYDASCLIEVPPPEPLSSSIDFMDNLEGELNRRLAVLALLYLQRRRNPSHPEVSLMEVEIRMGFPRDYLDFTMWYLHKKGYITRADNASFTLTADGVDFVENQQGNTPILQKMLTTSHEPRNMNSGPAANAPVRSGDGEAESPATAGTPSAEPMANQRVNAKDRRVNAKDRRVNSRDRRSVAPEQSHP